MPGTGTAANSSRLRLEPRLGPLEPRAEPGQLPRPALSSLRPCCVLFLSTMITAHSAALGLRIPKEFPSGPFQGSEHSICMHLYKLCICVLSSLTLPPNEIAQTARESTICSGEPAPRPGKSFE